MILLALVKFMKIAGFFNGGTFCEAFVSTKNIDNESTQFHRTIPRREEL